jgi:hypothetical protein
MLQPVSRRRQVLLSVILTIAGVALLVWYVRDAGIDELREHLTQVGWGFLGILAVSLGRLFVRSLAWRTLIAQPVPIGATLAATLTGDAIGNVTPLSLAVSEPAKAVYLGRGVPGAHAFAALAAENFFYSVSVAVYVILGTAAMLTAFDLPPNVERAGVAALGFMAAVLAGAGWLAWQRPALLSAVVRRLPLPKLVAIVERVRDFETRAYGSVGGQGARLGAVVALHLVFHVLSFIEAWLTVYLLTGRSEPLAAFVLDTANRVVNVVFRMVPMRAGVDEVTSGAVAAAVGLPNTIGVATALVRKGRVAVWALVGFSLLARRGWQRQR